jgi:hypothetical protein
VNFPGEATLSIKTPSMAAILVLGVVVLMPVDAAAAGVWIGDVEARVLPLPSLDNRSGQARGTCHGYIEYRVQLRNRSAQERIVDLSYPDGEDRYGVVVSRRVAVAGGQEVLVSLFQPPVTVAQERLKVRVQGVRDGKYLPVTSLHQPWHGHNERRPAVLLGRNVPQDFRDGGGTKKEAKSGSEEEPYIFLRSELPVSQWSPNWLGYSCFDVIVLTEKEAEEMPPQVQLAIQRYLECGGTLLVHARRVPAALAQFGQSDGKGGAYVGLGHAAAGLAGRNSDWRDTYQRLERLSVHVYRPEEKPAKSQRLLVAETTVPVRGLFVLVLAFGIGIGPANLWLLSRYKRRVWLWWNVPAISLVTCLAVFGYSLASEGVTGRGKTATLTWLDQRCHRATTIGYVSYYCPLTPGQGPRFSADTDVARLESDSTGLRKYMRNRDDLCLVDWTEDQYLAAGWVNARVSTYFQIRKNEDRRERLTVQKKADGSLVVVNALGANIRQLYLVDGEGKVFEGQEILAGKETTLKPHAPTTLAAKGSQAVVRDLFRGPDWLAQFDNWTTHKGLSGLLSHGTYVAYLDKSPFVEEALSGVEAEHPAAIVYGILKEQDDGR